MATEIGWALWKSFLAVLETGSLSGAARRLSTTQPTIGRHIDQLETALDIPLFTRSKDGLFPTRAATALKVHAETMASSAKAMERLALGGDSIEGTVRLTASEIVGLEILPNILAEMKKTYAGLSIELAISNAQDDLLRRDADIAIRMVRPTQKRLVAKKICDVALGLFAHKDYLANKVTPVSLDALMDYDLIGIDRDFDRWQDFSIGGKVLTPSDLSFRSDSDLAQLAALRAGLGIGICQNHIAARNKDLIPILPEDVSLGLEMWLVMHEDQRAHQTCRAMFDYLAPALKRVVSTI